MWWKYLIVFGGCLLVDVFPIPLPPAFTVMVFLQIKFDLPIWPVINIGIVGSIVGRIILTLYIPRLSQKFFKPEKNEDVRFLGNKLKEKGWKSHLFIFIYSLLPLPTTPLFIGAGMAGLSPWYVIPGFILGKFPSDTVAVLTGKYATENTEKLIHGIISWKSILGLVVGLLLITLLVFVDWRTLLEDKKLRLRFNVFKK
jgi:membrane protein DedA with SNARE-associated domain